MTLDINTASDFFLYLWEPYLLLMVTFGVVYAMIIVFRRLLKI